MLYIVLEAKNLGLEKQNETLEIQLTKLKESRQRSRIVPLMLPHDAKLSDELDKVKRELEISRKKNSDLNTFVDFLKSQLVISSKMYEKWPACQKSPKQQTFKISRNDLQYLTLLSRL